MGARCGDVHAGEVRPKSGARLPAWTDHPSDLHVYCRRSGFVNKRELKNDSIKEVMSHG